MEDYKTYQLDELIAWALEEHFIDACKVEEQRVFIALGRMEIALSTSRAHAFLRGVIKGMTQHRRCRITVGGRDEADDRPGSRVPVHEPTVAAAQRVVDRVRRAFLDRRWHQYRKAGCPLGRTYHGVMTWIRYETYTTVN